MITLNESMELAVARLRNVESLMRNSGLTGVSGHMRRGLSHAMVGSYYCNFLRPGRSFNSYLTDLIISRPRPIESSYPGEHFLSIIRPLRLRMLYISHQNLIQEYEMRKHASREGSHEFELGNSYFVLVFHL